MGGDKSPTTGSSNPRPLESAPRELRRVLNVALGVAIVVGGAIGVGILRTPHVSEDSTPASASHR